MGSFDFRTEPSDAPEISKVDRSPVEPPSSKGCETYDWLGVAGRHSNGHTFSAVSSNSVPVDPLRTNPCSTVSHGIRSAPSSVLII